MSNLPKFTIYNTMSRTKEAFKSISEGKVGMYYCGPTVYDYVHLGNLRAFVVPDIMRRCFEFAGYNVTQVINITDFGHLVSDADTGEDKMLKGLRREGKEPTLQNMLDLGTFYMNAAFSDGDDLNVKRAHHNPRASEHIAEDIKIIEKLFEKGFAYPIENDGIYFDTQKDTTYGKLRKTMDQLDSDSSRLNDISQKRNARDFNLWKFNSETGWDSPWGKGFPGWHIECSGMSMKYLGETFDIHGGGIEHIPIHHTNEIAQSECCTGKTYSNYWVHHEWVNIKGGKMAKSSGESYTLATLKEKGFSPLAYRYLLLQSHYRSPVAFSWDTLEAAQNGLNNIYKKVSLLSFEDNNVVDEELLSKFTEIITDDFNTAEALPLLHRAIENKSLATILKMDEIFGLKLDKAREFITTEIDNSSLPQNIQNLLLERSRARQEKDWEKSDEIRDELLELGYRIKDNSDGTINIEKA